MTNAELFEDLILRMDQDIASGKYADKAKKESGFRSTQMCALLDQVIQAGVFQKPQKFAKPSRPPGAIKIKPADMPLRGPPDDSSGKRAEIEIIRDENVKEESLPNIGPIELESE